MEVQPIQISFPTKEKDRIFFLDVLRGISILFIFIANSVYFSGFFNQSEATLKAFGTYKLDNTIDFISFTLIDGKFYSIFSILFGIGFTIQYIKHKNQKGAFILFFSKRMLALLLFGLVHIYFFSGDILTLYALVGFVLLLFRNCKDKQLLLWAGLFLLTAPINTLIMQLSGAHYPYYFFEQFGNYWKYMGLPMEGEIFNYSDIGYHHSTRDVSDFLKISLGNPLNRIGGFLLEGRPFKVLALFLLGIWAGRKILKENLLNNTRFLQQVVFWGLLIGLPMNLIRSCIEFEYLNFNSHHLMIAITYTLGVSPLACAFAAILALRYRQRKKFLNYFAPVGRMALTNYISQSFISILLFFGIGFGLSGKWGMTITFLIVTGIFILQLLWSSWWLKHFRFGPLEWVWRQLTYGKFVTNKKSKP